MSRRILLLTLTGHRIGLLVLDCVRDSIFRESDCDKVRITLKMGIESVDGRAGVIEMGKDNVAYS